MGIGNGSPNGSQQTAHKGIRDETTPLLPVKVEEEGFHEFNGASFSGAVFNLSTTIVGAGIMALAASIKMLGIIPGILMIIIVALLTEASIGMLVRCSHQGKITSYGWLMGEAYGQSGRIALETSVVITTLEISRSGGYVQQSPGPRVSSDQNCIVTLRLQFENSCSSGKYSTHEIEADDETPLKVAIYDYNNRIITYEPFSSMRVHIVAIHGDFDDDHKGQWTDDYFRSKIVLGRPRKEHLLSGKLYFRLQNGVGYLNGVKFQDNSSFVPSKRFKLAVMADDQRITERIQEGITESFAVKDVGGYPSKKNPYPSPSDPVQKLTRIAINGERHKALENNKIKTVEDFLCSYSKDEKKLRKERNMSDEQEPIFRNSGSSNLRGSCSMQPSPTEQARFHDQDLDYFQ